ncbi:MAG TPA: 3-hydroxyacyl-CoA dehydrogenase NAD-binding domain-containing protein, partial [Terrimicrobiaceae bacterium]
LLTASETRAGMDRIVPTEASVPMGSVDLVVEAVSEKLEIKKAIFADLEPRVHPETILATNTSALSITEISHGLRNPARVVGLHFFNPVHRMKLVEIVRSKHASDEAIDTAVAFVKRIGKLPVVVADQPGFLVNRILLPYLLEAGHLFAAGVAVESIDESMLEFGMPMGPLRLLDEVGLDVAEDVGRTLCAAFPDRMQIPKIFSRFLDAGLKGKKSGKGFYLYRKGRVVGTNGFALGLRGEHDKEGLSREQLRERMVLLMINEAARCLDERIVEDPKDVDFAMIMGTGFAPFRGGPLRYADTVGLGTITETLQRLTNAGESRFAPCTRLVEMSRENKRFYES